MTFDDLVPSLVTAAIAAPVVYASAFLAAFRIVAGEWPWTK